MDTAILVQGISWLVPLGIVAASIVIGIWLRRVAVAKMLTLASRTRWAGDDMILRAVRNPLLLWSVMAGTYLAMASSDLPKHVAELSVPILKTLWILSLAWVSANVVAQLITHHASRWQIALPMTSLTQNLAKSVVWGLGLLMVLDSLGVKIGSLLAALGIGSLAVALGLQDTLSNVFAGVYVTLSKHIRVGDYVKLESGQEGYVTDIGWRATKIRMLSNSLVIIPNAKIGQSVITNYDLPDKELAVSVEVAVDYASDLERVERVTTEVAAAVLKTVPGAVPTFEPCIRYHTFGDPGVNFTVVLRAREFADQFFVKHEFIKRLHARYRQEGIAFPVRTVLLGGDRHA